eukprot:g6573.t1
MPSSPARRKRGSVPHDQLSPDLFGKEVAVASSSTQQGAAKRQKRDGEFVLGSKSDSDADGKSAASKRPDLSGPAPAPQQQQLALFPKASRLERFCRDVFSVCGLLKPLEACLLWAQVEKQKSCKSKQKLHLFEEEVDLAKHDWSRDRGRNPNPNAVGQPGHCVRHIQRYRRLYNEHAGKGDKVWFEGTYAQNTVRYERELHFYTRQLQEFKQLPGIEVLYECVPTTAAARSGWALFVQDSWAGASSSGASGAVFWKKLKTDWANTPEASKAAYAERAWVAKEREKQYYEANVYPSPEYQRFAARQQKLKSGFYRGYLPRKVWQKLAKELELCVVCEEEGLEDEDGVERKRCKEDVVFEMLEWFPTSAKDRTEVILKVRKLAGEWLESYNAEAGAEEDEDVEDVEEGDHSTESEEDSSSADQHDVGENSSDEDGSSSCSSSDSDGEPGGDEEKEGQASSHKSSSYKLAARVSTAPRRGAVLTRAFIQRAQDEFRGVKLFSAGARRQPCAAKDDVDLAKLAQELDVIIEENGDEIIEENGDKLKDAPLDDPAARANPEQEEPDLDSLLLQNKGAHSLLPQEGRGRRSKRKAKVQFNGRKKVRKFGLGDLNEEKDSCDVNILTCDEESDVEVSDHQQMSAAEEQQEDDKPKPMDIDGEEVAGEDEAFVNLRQEKLEKLNAQLLRDKMLNSALTAKAFKKADLRAARSLDRSYSSSKPNKAKRNGNGNTPAAHEEEHQQHVVLQGILKNKNEPVKIDRNANAKATKQSGSCVLGGRKLRAGLVCFAGVDAGAVDDAGAGEGDVEEDHAAAAAAEQEQKKEEYSTHALKQKKAYSTHASYTKMLAARVDTDPLHVSRGWYAGESSKFEWGGIDLKQHGRAILTPKQIKIASAFGVGVGKKMQKEKASGLNSGGGGGKKVKEQEQPGKDKPPVQDMAVEEDSLDGVGILKYKLAADGPSNHKLALSPGKERSRTVVTATSEEAFEPLLPVVEQSDGGRRLQAAGTRAKGTGRVGQGKGDSAHCSKKAGSSAVVKTVMKRARK